MPSRRPSRLPSGSAGKRSGSPPMPRSTSSTSAWDPMKSSSSSCSGLDDSETSLFAVIRTRGPAWQESRPMESQAAWAAHASFMNALAKDGFVLLGGPLEGTNDVLLVIRAHSREEVCSRLAADPWAANDLLQITGVAPWTLRLGSLE